MSEPKAKYAHETIKTKDYWPDMWPGILLKRIGISYEDPVEGVTFLFLANGYLRVIVTNRNRGVSTYLCDHERTSAIKGLLKLPGQIGSVRVDFQRYSLRADVKVEFVPELDAADFISFVSTIGKNSTIFPPQEQRKEIDE